MSGNDVLTGYTPPRRRAPAVIISGVCLFAAAALLIVNALGIGWRSVLQLAAAALSVAAIEITTRFVLTQYTYAVIYGSGGIDFTVGRIGKRETKTVASIAMTTVKGFEPYTDLRTLEKKFGHIQRTFNYTANMFPVKKGQLKDEPDTETKKHALVFEFNGATDVILIECSDEYAGYISDIVRTPKDIDKTDSREE